MENYLTKRYFRSLTGSCPYCNTEEGEFVVACVNKPQQIIQLHNLCNLYSMLNEKNDARYPLQKPNDMKSEPYI